jgi:hypothetical protein
VGESRQKLPTVHDLSIECYFHTILPTGRAGRGGYRFFSTLYDSADLIDVAAINEHASAPTARSFPKFEERSVLLLKERPSTFNNGHAY